jgi:low affinity Fe/Cu permease
LDAHVLWLGIFMTAKKNGGNGNGAVAHPPSTIASMFSHFAQKIAVWSGHPITFMLAVITIVAWVVTGPVFHYSDTWQLVINTGTTIVTFLMVFLIQNTQNRDMLAIQLKLSELVLAMKGAENRYATIEDLTDEELEELHNDCRTRAEMTEQQIEARRGVVKDVTKRLDTKQRSARRQAKF